MFKVSEIAHDTPYILYHIYGVCTNVWVYGCILLQPTQPTILVNYKINTALKVLKCIVKKHISSILIIDPITCVFGQCSYSLHDIRNHTIVLETIFAVSLLNITNSKLLASKDQSVSFEKIFLSLKYLQTFNEINLFSTSFINNLIKIW